MDVIVESWPVKFATKLAIDQYFHLRSDGRKVDFITASYLSHNFLKHLDSPVYNRKIQFYRIIVKFWQFSLNFFHRINSIDNFGFGCKQIINTFIRLVKTNDSICQLCLLDYNTFKKIVLSNLLDVHGDVEIRDEQVELLIIDLKQISQIVSKKVHKYDLPNTSFYLFNGRFPVDALFYEILKKHKVKTLFYEVGPRPNSIEIFNQPPHNILERRRIIREYWNHKPQVSQSTKVLKAIKYLENRALGNDSSVKFWTQNQNKDFTIPLPPNKNIACFFLSTIGEISAIKSNNPDIHLKDQKSSLEWLLNNLDFEKWHLVLRFHPLHDRHSKKSGTGFQFRDNQNFANLTIIDSGSLQNSNNLLRLSDLVFVYNSTIGVDAIFLGKPTIILGTPSWASDFHSLQPKIDTAALNNFGDFKIPIQNLYSWAYYASSGGRSLRYCYFKQNNFYNTVL